REGGSAYQAADGPSVALGGQLEDPVESPEEPPEQAVPQPSEPVLLGALGLEEERAHRRAQRERVERRQYGRHRDRERKLPIELARDAAEEGRRHEDRQRPKAIAMTAPVTSSMARCAASRGPRPSAMWRSTFSTTTIASSTTMP